jgi:hypothetical protein
MWVYVTQRMLLETAFDIAYFPVWWYTKGLKRVFFGCVHLVSSANASMAPGLWLRNMFVPMFGQTDWQGRLMSIFMRFVNVIGRTIGLVVWTCAIIMLCLFWVFSPLMLTYMLGISTLLSYGV